MEMSQSSPLHVSNTGDPVYDTFIRRSLGSFLPDCIRELSESRPADPIEFISNALYKAVDSEMYKLEKEKYLRDCVKEQETIQIQREERNARLEELIRVQRENKEQLKQARSDEIATLQYLLDHAAELGITLSPRTLRRLSSLKREAIEEELAEKPVQIIMPKIKIGTDGRRIVIRDDDECTTVGGRGKGRKGKWVDVEEVVTTASGRNIVVKTRKWQPEKPGQEGERFRGRTGKGDQHGSLYGDSLYGMDSMQGTITITPKGQFAFHGGVIGDMEPQDPLDTLLSPADNPDIWYKERFECQVLYDHELYIRCDAMKPLDVNYSKPPRKNFRDFLDTIGSSEEERRDTSSDTNQVMERSMSPHRSSDDAKSTE